PDCLADAAAADAVHTVVPVAGAHERQTMWAEAPGIADGADTMLIERSLFFRRLRQAVRVFLSWRERRPFEEGIRHVQHACVATDLHIVTRGEGQPEEIVREMRADAAARRRMPPVLHIAFDELMFRRAE